MKLKWKDCFRAAAAMFVLYLAIYYWSGISGWLAVFIKALAPLVVGGALAYLLNIPMSFLEKRFFPMKQTKGMKALRRGVCLLLSIAGVVLLIVFVAWQVLPELKTAVRLLSQGMPDPMSDLLEIASRYEILSPETIEKIQNFDWSKFITQSVGFFSSGIGSVMGVIYSAIDISITFLFGFIFAVYILIGKEDLQTRCFRVADAYLPIKVRDRIVDILILMDDNFHGFAVGQCMEALIFGSLCIIGMLIFRFPYAVMVGTLMGFMALIPVAGAYIGGAVGCVLMLTDSPARAIMFLVFYVVLQQFEDGVIYPRIVGNNIGLPAIWVLASITIGGTVGGIVGMLLGVPLTATVYSLIKRDVDKKCGSL